MNDSEMAGRIHEAALAHGFEVCGIVRVAEMAGYAEAIAGRIERYPQSGPMYERLAALAAPERSVPWAKSVVICARSYGRYRLPGHLNGLIGKSYIFDSRKDPRSREYRQSMLFEAALTDMGLRHMAKRDYGITALRWAAARAGIGVVRKNNFFYTANGSWCGLEAFLIDRELELKAAPAMKKCPDNCGRCVKACPTGALGEPFQMNGVACVSFLTSKAECAPGKANYDKCGGWIFGCDACQDACPFNRHDWEAGEAFPGLEELSEKLSYEQILAMDYATMREILPPKFWYISEDDVWKWKCNVLNAMHNTFEKRYLPHIEQALNDSRPEVRAMAEWVLQSVRPISA